MKLYTRKLTTLSPFEIQMIEDFLKAHYSTVFHEPHFNNIVSDIYNTSFSYCVVFNGNHEIVALCPVHAVNHGPLCTYYSNPTRYGLVYGGWVYDGKQISLNDLLNSMEFAIHESLSYWSQPQIESDDYVHVTSKKGFRTAIIDLGGSEEYIWNNYIDSKRRNMIRKAQKSGVSIATVCCANLGDFYGFIKNAYSKAGLTIKPQSYYVRLLDKYTQMNQAVIMLALRCTTLLATAVLLCNRHICHYWLGASSKEVNLGQGELLQWEAIKWAKRSGSKYYDLCVVESERLPQIARFKLGFSKKLVPFYYISRSSLFYKVSSRVQTCFGRH